MLVESERVGASLSMESATVQVPYLLALSTLAHLHELAAPQDEFASVERIVDCLQRSCFNADCGRFASEPEKSFACR